MPYAANGVVQQDPIREGVEITDEQYNEAIEGMCAGLMVTIDGGFKIVPVPDPEPVIPPAPTPEALAAQAMGQRDYLLSVAAIRIAPLQDSVDLGDETAEDSENLILWKQYRVALNRIEQQAGFPQVINWPQVPGETIA